MEFPKTLSIAKLRQLVEQIHSSLAEALKPADVLTSYGVDFRYPTDLGPSLALKVNGRWN